MTKFGPWKIWNGGENPCPCKEMQPQLRSEPRFISERGPAVLSSSLDWAHLDSGSDIIAYREVLEPVHGPVTMQGRVTEDRRWLLSSFPTHRITFDLIDGEPDCASIKMERMK